MPPQSISVSTPFLTPSLQEKGVGAVVGDVVGPFVTGDGVGAVEGVDVLHISLLQIPLLQSKFTSHAFPGLHGEHSSPPQSMSVSD